MKHPFMVGSLIVVVFCLIFVGAWSGWLGFCLNREIDPVSLATLGVTIFIAFFLQYYFAAKASDDRAEKDILIDSLRDALTTLRLCRDAVIACHESGKITKINERSILSLFRRLANALDNVETALAMSQRSALGAGCSEVQDAFFGYKGAATGGKFPKPYDRHDYGYQEQAYRKLSEKLHSLVFQINQG